MDVLTGALQAAAALEAVVQPCFGPNGLDVLFEGADGHAACTNSGVQLISSLRLSHPAGLLISRAVKEHHKITGDGSKKMLMTTTAALREIHKSCSSSAAHSGNALATEVSQATCELRSRLIGDILPQLVANGILCMSTTRVEEAKSLFPKVIHTLYPEGSLVINNPSFQVPVAPLFYQLFDGCTNQNGYSFRKKLMDILMSLLFHGNTSDLQDLKKQLQNCEDSLSKLTTYVPGPAMTESLLLPGFVIDREFVGPRSILPTLQNFRFVLLMTGLEFDLGGSRHTLSVGSTLDLQEAVEYFPRHLKQLVELLHKENVKLVLCGGRVTPATGQLLREHDIVAVQMVPEETLLVIAEYLGVHPTADITSLMLSLSRGDPCTCLQGVSCQYVAIGQRRFVHLELPVDSDRIGPHSLLLCAPTIGFCRQLAKRLRNTLLVTRSWYQQGDGGEFLAVAGGGAWEVAVIRELEKHAQREHMVKGSPRWIAVRALQKGLLSIPQTLYTSSLSQARGGRLAAEFHHKVFATEGGFVGVDCTDGCLKTVSGGDWPVWEPFSSQQLLLHSVTTLLSQLLKVDRIVSVPRIYHEDEWQDRDKKD